MVRRKRVVSAAGRARLSARLKGKRHPHRGHKFSATTRVKLSNRLKGRHRATVAIHYAKRRLRVGTTTRFGRHRPHGTTRFGRSHRPHGTTRFGLRRRRGTHVGRHVKKGRRARRRRR